MIKFCLKASLKLNKLYSKIKSQISNLANRTNFIFCLAPMIFKFNKIFMSGAVKVVAMKHDPEGKKRLITLTQEKYKTSTFLAHFQLFNVFL